MGIIYKITNKVNNKVYIGKTSKTVEARWKQHLTDAKSYYLHQTGHKRPLYDAFKKYGIENFTYEVLLECPDDVLNQEEQKYIALYHSYIGDSSCNGYNATIGGDGRPYELSSNELEKLITLYHKGYSLINIAKELNYDITVVSRKLHELGFSCKNGNRKPVYQVDKKTNQILGWFESCSDAAVKCFNNRLHNAHIHAAASGKRLTAYGYKWYFVEDYENKNGE